MENEFNAGYLSRTDTNTLMNNVYQWMMVGLLISGLSAFMVTHSSFLLHLLFGNPYAISAGIN